ncbi:MAG: 4-hydroxy-3-methylbut-2-enyl diphosphate reductase [Bacteroidales bacterium]|nr:4-hydroxy-3-methylbut-2-enyl diphosphate reductase [Bacteroidales bacterium]
MNLTIEIDAGSGFCNGVVRAVRKAESYLCDHDRLYSLGAIVHNTQEIERLAAKGLQIIDAGQMAAIRDDVVLVRAHGEPPATYALAERNNITVIDCTCPVVLQLQKKIASVYGKIHALGGTIVIFGKKGHAEVNGLVGRTDGNAIVVENIDEIEGIDFSKPVALFSQTTKDTEEYAALIEACRVRSEECGGQFESYDTICKQVAARHASLAHFAASHDVILFVSGHESSNGNVLYNLCLKHNGRTYWVEDGKVPAGIFHDGDSVGICGATSTPRWQLEELYLHLQNKIINKQ